MSHFSSLVYLSHRACFGALLNTTHTHSHGRDTCAMLRNARKATLNWIDTQRKKWGYKGWGSKLYLLTLGGVKHTTCDDGVDDGVEVAPESGVPKVSSRCWCRHGSERDNRCTPKWNPNTKVNARKFGSKRAVKVVKILESNGLGKVVKIGVKLLWDCRQNLKSNGLWKVVKIWVKKGCQNWARLLSKLESKLWCFCLTGSTASGTGSGTGYR